jgi:hypothetical protein
MEKDFSVVKAIFLVDVFEASVLRRNTCDFGAVCGVLGVQVSRDGEAGWRGGCVAGG